MPNLIHDEFTHLNVSHQRKYQMRCKRDGKCVQCGTLSPGVNCPTCAIKRRIDARGRAGCQPQTVTGRGRPAIYPVDYVRL